MNLIGCKQILIKYSPTIVSETIMKIWRGPLSFIRNNVGTNKYNRDIAPYFKRLFYKDLHIDMYAICIDLYLGFE